MYFTKFKDRPIIEKVFIITTIASLFGIAGVATYAYGMRRGAAIGFHATIEWFDKNFDNLGLQDLWLAWSKANPEKVINF